ELLRVGRVADLAVECDHVTARSAQRHQRVAIGLAGRLLAAELVGRQLKLLSWEAVWLAGALGLRNVDVDVADAAQLGDRLSGMRQRPAVEAGPVGGLRHPGALRGIGQ